jgi:hypothetical protein
LRAALLIREAPVYRRNAFYEGLRQVGARAESSARAADHDVLVIWNRYGPYDAIAREFEAKGKPVIIAENGYLGRDWRGGHWYAMARNFHNGAGTWPDGGPERWASMDVPLDPWRNTGGEVVVLATRSIGPPQFAEPRGWSAQVCAELNRAGHVARVRPHPGERPAVPLADDLATAQAVVTWGSGGALKALQMGIPVFHGFSKWIGAAAAAPYNARLTGAFLGNRTPMFERLAWAMWSTDEIASGVPFKCLLP